MNSSCGEMEVASTWERVKKRLPGPHRDELSKHHAAELVIRQNLGMKDKENRCIS